MGGENKVTAPQARLPEPMAGNSCGKEREFAMRYGFGVDVGGTTVKLAFFDQVGTLLQKWEIPTVTAGEGQQILPDIAAAVDAFLKEKGLEKKDILGIGLGVPGAVGSDGVVKRCVNLGWGILNVEKTLSDLTGLPVRVGNDANMAALGECWKGGGQGLSSMVLVTLGTGVGGGIVVDGKILYGAHGACGEIGHMVQNRHETVACGCGKFGCAEQYCSATGIVRTARTMLAATDKPSCLRGPEELSCKALFDAGAAGDEVALEILEAVYSDIAEFVSNVCSVMDPEAVVLGGGVSKAGTVLIEGIRRHMSRYIFHAMVGLELRLARLGNDAGAYGAFKLILDAAEA